jgi:hypothetical protein
MSKIDQKLPTDVEKLKKIADETDNPQLKRAIETRLKIVEKDKIVKK